MGIVPSGTYHNRAHSKGDYASKLTVLGEDLVFDPQTSGGLLISVSKEQGADLYQELADSLGSYVKIIGNIEKKQDYYLYLEE